MTVNNSETKIPACKVPIFRGDTLDGDEYIWMVKTTFQSNAISQFLEDTRNCDNSPYWLEVFASRSREYIEESDILSFLVIELYGENNSDKVWAKIERHLSSTGIMTA